MRIYDRFNPWCVLISTLMFAAATPGCRSKAIEPATTARTPAALDAPVVTKSRPVQMSAAEWECGHRYVWILINRMQAFAEQGIFAGEEWDARVNPGGESKARYMRRCMQMGLYQLKTIDPVEQALIGREPREG